MEEARERVILLAGGASDGEVERGDLIETVSSSRKQDGLKRHQRKLRVTVSGPVRPVHRPLQTRTRMMREKGTGRCR